jgi:glycosyltransferase involved in cell wall biosynthesis
VVHRQGNSVLTDYVLYEPRFQAKLDHSCFFLIFTIIMTARYILYRTVESAPSMTGQNPRTVVVTVLMPNYNKGAYIERAIRSVLSQTLRHLELVISDDHSDDLPWYSLLPLLRSDLRIQFHTNSRCLGINRNRVKCVCLSHGMWLLSLDSDDTLMNRTAEVVVNTQRETGADMIEFKSLQITPQGRCDVLDWGSIPFTQADNNTLVKAFRVRQFNCYLWRKMIARSIYQRALLMMGFEMSMATINVMEDRVHCASVITLVQKFVSIDYFGYMYHRNIYNSSHRRTPNWWFFLKKVNHYIRKIFLSEFPHAFDDKALQQLCVQIDQ